MDPLDLIFGDDPKLIQAQSPVPRPDPIQRPGEAAPRAKAPRAAGPPRFQFKPADAPAAGGTYAPAPRFEGDPLDLIFGDDKPKSQARSPQAAPDGAPPFPGYKDPKKEGWLEWMDNNITGRVDPRYKGLPSFSTVMKDEIFDGNSDDARAVNRAYTKAAILTPDEKAHMDIVRKSLGDRFIGAEKDAYGADVILFKEGRDGNPLAAYLNKPGLDGEDVDNALLGSVPYLLGGRVIGGMLRNAGTATKMGGQAVGAFGTSLGGDIAANVAGSDQAPDITRASVVAGTAGVLEGIAPALGRLWRTYMTEPSLFNKQTGQLTPKGVQAAQKAGFDPADITQLSAETAEEFAKKYAAIRDPVVAGQSTRTGEFGIPVTRGQLTKDPARLLNEKGMRYGAFGEGAKDTMQGFDKRQAQAISDAAFGDPTQTGRQTIAGMIAPGRLGQGGILSTGAVGSDIRDGVRSARNAAATDARLTWDQVGKFDVQSQALDALPKAVGDSLGDLASTLTPDNAPAASKMINILRGYVNKPDRPTDAFLGNAKQPTPMSIQRQIGGMMKGAADDYDRSAASAVYQGFMKWFDDMADNAMLTGDAATAATWRIARDRTREMKAVFGERGIDGQTTPGGTMIASMLDDNNMAPEAIVRNLFGVDTGAVPKQGALEAISRIRDGLFKYLPKEQATPIWDDIRLAHWMNVVKAPDGQLHTPTMMAKRIDQAFNRQGSILNALYEPQERALIRRFGAAMRDIAYKDPNPSGTATSNLFYSGQWGQALLSMLGSYNGPIAKVAQMIMGSTPVKGTIGNISAGSAVNPRLRPANPSLSAVGASVAAQREQHP